MDPNDRAIWEQLKRIADALEKIEGKLDKGMKPTYVYFDECPPGVTELFRKHKLFKEIGIGKRIHDAIVELNSKERRVKDEQAGTGGDGGEAED